MRCKRFNLTFNIDSILTICIMTIPFEYDLITRY